MRVDAKGEECKPLSNKNQRASFEMLCPHGHVGRYFESVSIVKGLGL